MRDVLTGLIGIVLLAGLGGGLFAAAGHPADLRRAALEAELQKLGGERRDLLRRIEAWEQAGEAADLPSLVVHAAADQSAAMLSVQGTLVELGRRSGLELSSFAAARPPAELIRPAVAVEIEGQGDFSAIGRFLAGIEALSPRLAVSQLSLRGHARGGQAGMGAPGAAPVLFQLVVWGFWAPEEAA